MRVIGVIIIFRLLGFRCDGVNMMLVIRGSRGEARVCERLRLPPGSSIRLSELSDNLRSFLLGSDNSDSDLLGEIIAAKTGYNGDLVTLVTQEPAVVCHWSLEYRRERAERHKCVVTSGTGDQLNKT